MKIAAIQVSPGHNYFGHHGRAPGVHPMLALREVECVAGRGLSGDRFFDHAPDYRGQITFFAEEVHQACLRELKAAPFPPAVYRRNVLSRGVDLNRLVDRDFTVQGVAFRGTAECKPCFWMNHGAAPGAEAWLQGRGGLRARILSGGVLRVDCPSAAGVLLAGGRGRRAGRDKAGLDWQGRPLGEHQAATLAQSGCWPLLLSCRPDQPWTPAGFSRLEDPPQEEGPIEAVVRALEAAPAPVLVVLAIDLPLITPVLLSDLAGAARETGRSQVPRAGGRFEPLAAAWHRSALPALREAAATQASLRDTCLRLERLGLLSAVEVAAGERALFANLNTPQDVAAWS